MFLYAIRKNGEFLATGLQNFTNRHSEIYFGPQYEVDHILDRLQHLGCEKVVFSLHEVNIQEANSVKKLSS